MTSKLETALQEAKEKEALAEKEAVIMKAEARAKAEAKRYRAIGLDGQEAEYTLDGLHNLIVEAVGQEKRAGLCLASTLCLV